MKNHRSRPAWLRTALLWLLPLLVIAALTLIAQLRGPELPGYRIESRPLVQTVVATGRIISTSRTQVGSEITGTVRERRVKEGSAVKAGDVLVVLNAEDLAARVREAEAALAQLQLSTRPQAEAILRQADAQAAQAARERQRRAQLFSQQLIAREALEQAEEAEAVARAAADSARVAASAAGQGHSEEQQLRERLLAARAQLAKTSIRAQASGVVLVRNVEPGDLVQPGRVLFEIARDGVTEIEVPVDEKNLAMLAVGQTAHCIADAYPDQPFPAVINYISPGIDAQRGTVTVRLMVANVPTFLRQDMTVSVNIETGRRDAALALPNDAIIDATGATPTVLAVREGTVARLPVQLGLTGLGITEVKSGLAAGDVVLAAAAALKNLTEGARVRVALEQAPLAGPDAARREVPVNFN